MMITKNQRGSSLEPLLRDVRILNESGLDVARYKLELNLVDLNDALHFPLNTSNYVEVHIKVPSEFPRHNLINAAISSNPKTMGYYFFNMRARSTEEFSEVLENIETLKEIGKSNNFQPLEIHKEYTLFDSKASHDSWWI